MTLDYYQKPFLDHNSKFLILTSSVGQNFTSELKDYLNKVPIENFVILQMTFDEVLIDFNDYQLETPIEIDDELIDEIYSKKLKKYPYHVHNIFAVGQVPRVILVNRVMFSKLDGFLQTMAMIEDSRINYITIIDKNEINSKHVSKILLELTSKRMFELTLNTLVEPNHVAPRLMTYEEGAYCLMVPKQTMISKKKRLFLKVGIKN